MSADDVSTTSPTVDKKGEQNDQRESGSATPPEHRAIGPPDQTWYNFGSDYEDAMDQTMPPMGLCGGKEGK